MREAILVIGENILDVQDSDSGRGVGLRSITGLPLLSSSVMEATFRLVLRDLS